MVAGKTAVRSAKPAFTYLHTGISHTLHDSPHRGPCCYLQRRALVLAAEGLPGSAGSTQGISKSSNSGRPLSKACTTATARRHHGELWRRAVAVLCQTITASKPSAAQQTTHF